MRKMKILIFLSISLLFGVLASFQRVELQTSDYLIQKWVYADYENGNMIYRSMRKFKKDRPGIEFKDNGILKRRQNSKWSAAPPIDYELVSGTWKSISDSLIEMEYENWSGLIKDTLQIIELSESKLVLKSFYN
jgi:hypothetical protein